MVDTARKSLTMLNTTHSKLLDSIRYLESLQERIREIESIKSDPEGAGFKERKLFLDFITYVSHSKDKDINVGQLEILAKVVLESTEIKFPRW